MIIFLAKNTKIAPKVKGQAEMSPKSNHIIEFAIRRIHVKLCRFLIRSFLSFFALEKNGTQTGLRTDRQRWLPRLV